MVSVNVNLLWMILGTFAALSIGTVVRLMALRNAAAEVVQKRMGSLKVWWVLALLWSVAAMAGQVGATLLMAIASFLALREYLRLIGTTAAIGRGTIVCLVIGGTIHYGLIASGEIEIAKIFLPISLLLLFAAVRSTTSGIQGYIPITTGVYWGAMLMIYGFAHSLFLFQIDTATEPKVGVVGWFLFVVVISEANDIMQAIVGRRFGKRKITPLVSPNKTYEGLAGGLVASIGLALLLVPCLTTLADNRGVAIGLCLSVSAGVLISIAGFLGDINMSAVKRDAGVKDGSSLLPGMGGMIDRIDSLTFTGPVFYYFVLVVNHFTAWSE